MDNSQYTLDDIVNGVHRAIPFFQKQEALRKTWGELQLQINPEDMITIVDDYSPDGVPDFDCQCTEVIRPPKHTPLPPGYEPHIYRLNTLRNYGVEHAKHDACIILDPDLSAPCG